MKKLIHKLKGGSGSGHWAHAGRPGKHGGSIPGAGIMQGLGLSPISTLEQRRERAAAARGGRKYKIPNISELEKHYNLDNYSGAENAVKNNCYKDPPACDALNTYTSLSYVSLNSYLRNKSDYDKVPEDKSDYDEVPEDIVPEFASPGVPKHVTDTISNMDRAFDTFPRVPQDIKVYRATDVNLRSKLRPGMIFEDAAFISTTINSEPNDLFGGLTLEIRVPKGSKGIYIAPISNVQSERELLLNRGSRFKVLKNDGRNTVLELIPEDSEQTLGEFAP